MIGHCLAALLTLSLAPLIGGINQTPVERLNYAAQHLGSAPSELGYEAKQRSFDYRRYLLQAIEGKREAVVALCEFTIAEIPTAASRRHADVLANLLQHFGDNSFSDALRGCPLAVRRRVLLALDRQLGPQLPRRYPKTASLR